MVFCENCGKQLEERQKFCDGCGAAVSESAQIQHHTPPTPAPIHAPINTTNFIAKSFICNGCGTPLKIPKNSRGHVQCPSCKNDCVLEGLVKNAEILAKANINSGIPLEASPEMLHRQLVSILLESPYIPLDLFNIIEVIRQEHYCVPAYCFECEGSASFSYDTGHERVNYVDRGDSVEKRTHIEWTTIKEEAAATETIFTPGEKILSPQIEYLYMKLNADQLSNQLVDVEELCFPPDVETYDYNLPETAAFNEYVKPKIETLLKEDAERTFYSKNRVRNFSMGRSRIHKEMKRIFLGLYRTVYNYGGKEYAMWATGDGENIWYDELPCDAQRKKMLDQKTSALSAAKALKKKGVGWLVFGLVACIIIALCLVDISSEWTVIFSLGALLFAILIPIQRKKAKIHNEQVANANKNAQGDLEAFEAPLAAIKEQFKSQQKALRGIYEKVSGDASKF